MSGLLYAITVALAQGAQHDKAILSCPKNYAGSVQQKGPGGMTREELVRRLELLRMEHRDLDTAILALSALAVPDQMAVARLKKRKLRLRDEISWIEDQLVPDIIA